MRGIFFMLGRLRRTIQPRSELPSPGTAESGSGPPELPGIRCGIGLDHLIDDPASYYDYALATLVKFQLHDHICSKILKQDVHACNYFGSKEVGDFLRGILSLGATRDWRAVIKEATGEPISPRAMMAYFAPLTAELEKRNAGKDCSR